VQFLGSIPAEHASQLFRPREYLHALPASIWAPADQGAVHITFPSGMLTSALKDPARCPVVVLVTGVRAEAAERMAQGSLRGPLNDSMLAEPAAFVSGSSSSNAAAGRSSAAGGGQLVGGGDRHDAIEAAMAATEALAATRQRQQESGAELLTELMIVQFAPAASQSAAAAAAASAAQALPPPAVAAAAAVDEAEDNAQGGGDGETKEDEVDPAAAASGAASSRPAAATAEEVTSPVNPALQDSVTSRVRFERLVAVGSRSGFFELDEVYGLETAEGEAECIICLTDLREVLLLPCKHACVCAECKKSISKCPICRARIGSYLRFAPKDEPDLKAARKEQQKLLGTGEP